ncbi:MAG TPA: MBL fold metallo-hydrolase [bacterium]|nr:MBL fold metallo-hydrolase [bacterium]
MSINVTRLPVGPLSTNCYLVSDQSGKGYIIDPGFEAEKIIRSVQANDVSIQAILLTHGHYDHVLAAGEVATILQIPVWIHSQDLLLAQEAPKAAQYSSLRSATQLTDMQLLDVSHPDIRLDKLIMQIIYTPGHTPGSVCYLIDNLLFSGDTLFRLSIGRTDLPGGSFEQIKKSLAKLIALPNTVTVYPGHGEITDLAFEKQHNPFI